MASLTKSARQERARLLRELLLYPSLKKHAAPTPDYTAALTDLIEELVVTDTNSSLSVSVTDLMGNPDPSRHGVVAAARLVMGVLETAPGRTAKTSALTANLTHRGFTANTLDAALSWMVEQNLVTAANGTATDITGDRRPSQPRRALPAELVTPRATGTASPASTGTASSTPVSNRPNMTVGNLIEPPEQVDMGKRMREQAGGTRGFDPGDLSVADTAPKTDTKKPVAAPTIPDSVMVAYTESVLSTWARHASPTATWNALPWSLPTIDLPEGATPTTVTNAVVQRLIDNGTLTRAGEGADAVWTHTPAARFVDKMTTWLLDTALPAWAPDSAVTAATVAGMDGIRDNTPSGWNTETLVQMAIDAAVSSGVLVTVDGVARTKPAPKTDTPKTDAKPAPAGDTTSSAPAKTPEGTAPMAPASGQVAEAPVSGGKKTETPAKQTPATVHGSVPRNGDIELRLAALERKAETTVDGVNAIFHKTERIESLVSDTAVDRSRIAEAPEPVREVLVTIAAKLHRAAKEAKEGTRDDPSLTNNELKKSLSNRPLRGESVAARDRFEAARQLGLRTGVIRTTQRSRLVFVSFEPLMESDDFARRLANMGVRVAARTKGLVDAARSQRVGASR